MDFMSVIILVLAILPWSNGFTKNNYDLELVQIIFQHGDTTPFKRDIYDKDPFDASDYEPWGYGHLTDVGKKRQYTFGQKLRKSYGDFIANEYNAKELYTYSSSEEHSKMSLNFLLDGLYSDPENPQPAGNYPRVEHYHERVGDFLNPQSCPDFLTAKTNVLNDPKILESLQKYEGLYEYLKMYTGEDCTAHDRIVQITNVLISQLSMNLELPEWCTPGVVQLMTDMTIYLQKLHSYTPEMKRLNGGPIIQTFWEHLNQKSKKKMYLYSGSQENVAAFARALSLNYPKYPAFGSALILEKWRNDKNQPFVRIMAWSGSDMELMFPLVLSDCDEYCPMEEYHKIIQPILPSEQQMKCLQNGASKKSKHKKH